MMLNNHIPLYYISNEKSKVFSSENEKVLATIEIPHCLFSLWQMLAQVARKADTVNENCDLLSHPQECFRALIKIR